MTGVPHAARSRTPLWPAPPRVAAGAGIAAPLIFWAGIILATWLGSDFLRAHGWSLWEPGDSWPSATALAEHGWIQSANFALTGTLLLVFIRAFRGEFRRPLAGRIAGTLLTVLAVALALSAFNTDFGTFVEGPETWNGWIHDLAFVAVALSAITGMAATALALRGNERWRGFPLAAGLVALLIPVSLFIPGGAGSYGFLLLLFGWFEFAALRFWRLTRERPEISRKNPGRWRAPGTSSAPNRSILRTLALLSLCALAASCGNGGSSERSEETGAQAGSTSASGGRQNPDGVVEIGGGRGLYLRCTGTGSPTVVMEGGDEDTSDSYAFAEPSIAAVTRACVYDRANLGRSDPAPGPRGLSDLVGDLETLLRAAKIAGPYVLVGTSGGGYISAGYAYENPDEVAGMVFVEVPAPFRNPPREIVEATDPNRPSNVERRDYLQVEKDAWAARERIGDIPITIISNEYSTAEISASPFPSEARGMRRNVEDQKGWLVLSPQAKQVVVHTGHAVEEADPDLVIEAILDVVKAAQ